MKVLVIRESITDVKNELRKYGIGKIAESGEADYVMVIGKDTYHGFVIRLSDDTLYKIFKLKDFYDAVNAVDFGNPFYNHYIFVRSVSCANGVPIEKVKITKVLSKKLREKAKWK